MQKRPLLLAALVIASVASVLASAPAGASPDSPAGPGLPPPRQAPQGPTRGWIGVALQAVTNDLAAALHLTPGDGALVSAVVPDGPAASAGVRVGDVIVEVGGTRIRGAAEVQREIWSRGVGTGVPIVVLRGSRRTSVVVLTAAVFVAFAMTSVGGFAWAQGRTKAPGSKGVAVDLDLDQPGMVRGQGKPGVR